MFSKAIWDKLPECIFENFEIAKIQNSQKSRGWFIPKIAKTKMWLTIIKNVRELSLPTFLAALNQQTVCIETNIF